MEFVAKTKIIAVEAGVLLLALLVGVFIFSMNRKVAHGFLKPPPSSSGRPLYKVGDSKTFPAYDFSVERSVSVGTRCVRVGQYSYLFVQNNLGLPSETLNTVGKVFDEEIYPGYSDAFLRQFSPGLNADYRVTILFLDESKAYPKTMQTKVVRGFYWQINELSKIFSRESAESKVIYIFSNPQKADVEDLLTTVEHETWHLKNWAVYKDNMGVAFVGIFSLATLFSVYLVLSHLYFKFMEMRV